MIKVMTGSEMLQVDILQFFASFSFLWPENGGKRFFQKQVGQGSEDLARISSRTISKAFYMQKCNVPTAYLSSHLGELIK